jgi:hypothetical protein
MTLITRPSRVVPELLVLVLFSCSDGKKGTGDAGDAGDAEIDARDGVDLESDADMIQDDARDGVQEDAPDGLEDLSEDVPGEDETEGIHLGDPCSPDSPGTCGEYACVDGVCCESSCSGPCQACNLPGREGTCVDTRENMFIMTAYSPRAPGSGGADGGHMDELAADYFTVIGLTYQQPDDPLFFQEEMNAAVAYDLCLIYPLGPTRTVSDFGEVGTRVGVTGDEVTNATAGQMDTWIADVENQIQAALADPVLSERIVAWYLFPEELRYWRARELELLQRMSQAVDAHDPQARPAWMYEPQHASSGRLQETIPYQDIVSVGIYLHHAGNDHQRIQVRHTMEHMMNAISYDGTGKPAIPVLEMYESDSAPYDPADIPLIPEFVRHDAYTAFANGASGIMIWSMGSRSGFNTYTDYYNAWAAVSNETFDLGLRDVFSGGTLLGRASATVLSGEATIHFVWSDFDETFPSLSVRDWSWDGRTYVLVVNSSEGSVGFTLHGLDDGTYQDVFTDAAYLVEEGAVDLQLPARGVIMLMK